MKRNNSCPLILGECVNCGKTKPVNRDHIPPKNLYAKPYPPNMHTVPSCYTCNGGASPDDEYFRMALVLTDRAKGNPAREEILPTVTRGLSKPEGRGLRRLIDENTAMMPRFTRGGLYMGHYPVVAFEGRRINAVVDRIVRGLFSRVKGHRLPDTHVVNILPVGRFRAFMGLHPEIDLAHREFVAFLRQQPLEEMGPPFAFQWAQSPNEADQSMWLLYFYGRMEFFCHTVLNHPDPRTIEEAVEEVRRKIAEVRDAGEAPAV